jgi:ferric-dicitrate binding protein FerR (iron transport regulator)
VGTSFNIKSASNQQQIEVVVFTGKVRLSLSSSQEELTLLPLEKALYRATSRSIIKTPEATIQPYLTGTQYEMQFEDTPLSEVIERIEQKFSIQIDVQNERANHCLVSADLTDQSLATTLTLVCQALGGVYRWQGEKVELRIPGCS